MLTKERQSEIALALVKAKVRRDGIPTFSRKNVDEDLERTAKETNLSAHELKEFLKVILEELWKEVF